jgi:uncharacterized membrane protein
MTIYLLAILIGVIAGLRTMTAPAAVSWAAHLGVLHLEGTWLAFLGNAYVPWIFTLAALGELVADQFPKTPSRKEPVPFGARIVSGALSGAAVGVAAGSGAAGLALGAVGAVLGTLGGPGYGPSSLPGSTRTDRPRSSRTSWPSAAQLSP